MKNLLSLLLIIALFSCDKEEVTVNTPEDNPIFEVGEFLSQEISQKRINLYQENNPDGAQHYIVGRNVFSSLLEKDNTHGIKIYPALKKDGTFDIIIYAIDKDANPIFSPSENSKTTCTTGCDDGIGDSMPCPTFCGNGRNDKSFNVNSIGSYLSNEEGMNRISRFQTVNPDGPRFYLIGKEVLSHLLSNENVEGVKILPALKDDGSFDVIIYGIDNNGEIINAKTNDDTEGVGDSLPCPTYCG